MAKLKAPRFLTTRARAKSEIYMWQPATRAKALGWKAVALNNKSGDASPYAMAIAQAAWLNAIYDAVNQTRLDAARMMVDAWAHGQSGLGLNLLACPFIAYPVPGLSGAELPTKITPQSFAELSADYQKSHLFFKLRHRTQQDYANILADFQPLLGPERVDHIKRKRLSLIYTTLIKKHNLASANARMRVLSVCLSFGIELEWIEHNPMHRFHYTPTAGRIRFPSEIEFEALINAAHAMPEGPRLDAVALMLAASDTGQRRADLVEQISLKQFQQGRMAFAQAKTKAFINVPVLNAFMIAGEQLVQLLEQRFGSLEKRFVELKLKAFKPWFRNMAETPLLWDQERGWPLDKYRYFVLHI